MLKVISVISAALVLFSACAGTSARNSSVEEGAAREARDAASAALAAMDNGGSAPLAAPQSTAPQADAGGNAPAQVPAVPRARPAWVDSPETVYPAHQYLSVVGYGPDRDKAAHDGYAKLTARFGQSVQSELKLTTNYSEAVKDGVIQVSEDTRLQNAIVTAAEMDSLIGAEIKDVWFDNQNIHYAAVVMEREEASVLYADLIRSNERVIGGLVDMPAAVKNSLDGYSRFILAGTIADANRVYANVLTIVGDTRGIDPAAMENGDAYRLEAAAVARAIPIGVTVTGDRDGRIKNAFAKALSNSGFRSGTAGSRYMLRSTVTLTDVEYPDPANKFVRYRVTGGLEDSAEGNTVLVPFDASGREGHLTADLAVERAISAAEKKIAGEFEAALKSYLASLLPKR